MSAGPRFPRCQKCQKFETCDQCQSALVSSGMIYQWPGVVWLGNKAERGSRELDQVTAAFRRDEAVAICSIAVMQAAHNREPNPRTRIGQKLLVLWVPNTPVGSTLGVQPTKNVQEVLGDLLALLQLLQPHLQHRLRFSDDASGTQGEN